MSLENNLLSPKGSLWNGYRLKLLKKSPAENAIFSLPLLRCQTIGFLEFLANLTPIIIIIIIIIIIMEERTKTI